MAQKQQALINCINKAVRNNFLYKHDPGMDPVKIRLRSDVHRVEQADQNVVDAKILQRFHDHKIGLLNPQNKPFAPVGGYPVLQLDELVLNCFAPQLDPKAWLSVKSQFDRHEIRRAYEKRGGEELLRDYSAIHQYPSAGFNTIRTHLAESDARIYNVKAGFDFHQHFTRIREERLRKGQVKDEGINQYFIDADAVTAMERVRNDTIKFLHCLIEYLEMLKQIKTRHLKSCVPINLAILGSEKDKDIYKPPPKIVAFPGGPPIPYNFKEQIINEAPPAWPIANAIGKDGHKHRLFSNSLRGPEGGVQQVKGARKSMAAQGVLAPPSLPPVSSQSSVFHSSPSPAPLSPSPVPGPGSSGRRRTYKGPAMSLDSDTGSDKTSPATLVNVFRDLELSERFRKRWPPPWMSLASMEQGCYIVDPACPTKETNMHINPPLPRRRKSLTNILETRKEWAEVRKNIARSVDECLEREDKEKLDFWTVQFNTLGHLPLSKPYPTHQRYIEDQMALARRRRQKTVILDCELSNWYKLLVRKVQEEVGNKDEEINQLILKVKPFFKLSANNPRMGKAKLCLVVMSLPAYVILKIPVQQAIDFILVHVLEAPEQLLTGWLAVRGLPNVLVKKVPASSIPVDEPPVGAGPAKGAESTAGVGAMESHHDVDPANAKSATHTPSAYSQAGD